MAIERKDIFTFQYFDYGEAFHGSYQGMRFRIGREPLVRVFGKSDEVRLDGTIRVYLWAEPKSFDNTSSEDMEMQDFSYSEEGVIEAIKWMNERWEETYAQH